MVTLESPSSRPLKFKGKSTDTKPKIKWGDLDIRNGETFFEFDTGEVYFYDKEIDDWIIPDV